MNKISLLLVCDDVTEMNLFIVPYSVLHPKVSTKIVLGKVIPANVVNMKIVQFSLRQRYDIVLPKLSIK